MKKSDLDFMNQVNRRDNGTYRNVLLDDAVTVGVMAAQGDQIPVSGPIRMAVNLDEDNNVVRAGNRNSQPIAMAVLVENGADVADDSTRIRVSWLRRLVASLNNPNIRLVINREARTYTIEGRTTPLVIDSLPTWDAQNTRWTGDCVAH